MTRRLPLLAVATVAPVVLTLVAVVVAVLVAPDLAAPVRVHWDAAGNSDGFAPGWSAIVGFAVVALAVTALVSAILAGAGVHVVTVQTKILALVPVFITALFGALELWILATQHQGAAAPPVWSGLLLGFGAAVVLVLAGWFALPPAVRVAPGADERRAEPLPLAAGERASWHATTTMALAARVGILAAILFAVAAVTLATVVTQGAMWPLYLVPVVLLVAFATTTTWHLRVDDDGLVVRAAAGFPVFRMARTDVAEAGTVVIRPLGDFGGWGLRWGTGRRFGIVTRAGEALQVTRRDGRILVVTVDDAATAAGLLTAVAAR